MSVFWAVPHFIKNGKVFKVKLGHSKWCCEKYFSSSWKTLWANEQVEI